MRIGVVLESHKWPIGPPDRMILCQPIGPG